MIVTESLVVELEEQFVLSGIGNSFKSSAREQVSVLVCENTNHAILGIRLGLSILGDPLAEIEAEMSHRAAESILTALISGDHRKGLRLTRFLAKYGSRATLHRRFQEWSADGSFLKAWKTLMTLMDRKGRLDWSESFVDGSFVPAKKGGPELKRRAAVKVLAGLRLSKAGAVSPSV